MLYSDLLQALKKRGFKSRGISAEPLLINPPALGYHNQGAREVRGGQGAGWRWE